MYDHRYLMMLFLAQVDVSPIFFFNDTATTEIYTLSLHDALPISIKFSRARAQQLPGSMFHDRMRRPFHARSEEHTSELQSHLNLVCRLLLEKKKKHAAQDSLTALLLVHIEGDRLYVSYRPATSCR